MAQIATASAAPGPVARLGQEFRQLDFWLGHRRWAGFAVGAVDGVRTGYPAWVASADGSWRSSLNRLQVNVPLPDSTFRRPE